MNANTISMQANSTLYGFMPFPEIVGMLRRTLLQLTAAVQHGLLVMARRHIQALSPAWPENRGAPPDLSDNLPNLLYRQV